MSRHRNESIGFDEIAAAIRAGAGTYRAVAAALDVSLDDPDLASAMNYMRHRQRIAFAGGCCTDSVEHSYDCEVTVL